MAPADSGQHTAPLARLRDALASVQCVRHFYYFPEIESTSDWARDLVQRAKGATDLDGTLIIADHQTKGRGRLARSWESPSGKSLLFTYIRANAGGGDNNRISAATSLAPALAVVATVRKLYPHLDTQFKYPNDVVIAGQKVAGILVEITSANQKQFVLTGIGVNLHQAQEELPPAPRMPATSLYLESGDQIDRAEFLTCLLTKLDELHQLGDGPVIQKANENCYNLGKWVCIETQQGTYEGIAECIDEQGRLQVRNPSLPGRVHTGEVASINASELVQNR